MTQKFYSRYCQSWNGPGMFGNKTKPSWLPLIKVIECADAAHGLGAHVMQMVDAHVLVTLLKVFWDFVCLDYASWTR